MPACRVLSATFVQLAEAYTAVCASCSTLVEPGTYPCLRLSPLQWLVGRSGLTFFVHAAPEITCLQRMACNGHPMQPSPMCISC